MNKMQVFVAGLVAGGTLTFSASGATASRQGASSRAYSYDVNDECYYTSDCYTVPVGSPGVDAGRLAPYHATWTQSVPKDSAWERTPATFEETLTIGEHGNWTHVQIMRPGNGSASIGTRTLDRTTLQILSLTLEFENGPPEQPTRVHYDMTGENFAADVTFADGRKVQGQPRDLAMPMFAGQIGGLTFAALPLRAGYVATLPMVIPNLGIYWIEASVIGKKMIPTADGGSVEVWEVNANWFNLTDGDIYEPGRDGDGGVYYIAVTPGDGIPPVIEYVNNGAIIAWDGVRRNR